MSNNELRKRSLEYHQYPFPGKVGTAITKPCGTQEELSLAYTPGVAVPCQEIHADNENAYRYTAKGNTVAVVSDGTAVLGLGRIGPSAALPVMEGKAVLFKRFADINAVPICLKDVHDENNRTIPERLIEITAALEPTFGGINLEDIGAPACFEIERRLKSCMGIPVFHDDQHGTAIISLAGVLNALQIVGKKLSNSRLVVNGAGAAGIACTEFYIAAGMPRENVIICDSQGPVYQGRQTSMTPEKLKLAAETETRTLADAIKGADIFLGLSIGNCVTKEMIKTMADGAIVFAMANPTPEIYPADALEGGAVVVGTGRTDFPNQVNNVLGFPGIFRGALDVHATDVNEDMKVAASKALAEIAQEKVPDNVRKYLENAYPEDAESGMFDGDSPLKSTYVIPKPFDPRVVPRVARRVAEAAIKSGVNRQTIDNLDQYEQEVRNRTFPQGS